MDYGDFTQKYKEISSMKGYK